MGTVNGVSSVLEANAPGIEIREFYYDGGTQEYSLYDPILASEGSIGAVLKGCHREFLGIKYGYLQLVWFMWRWLCSKVGVDIRNNKNWMSDGMVCSELLYYYLYYLGEPYRSLLKPFNPDTIQPNDVYLMCLAHPDKFKLVRKNGQDIT
jgi:hypothetical protein